MLEKTLKRAGFGFILGMAVGNLIFLLLNGPTIVTAQLLAGTGSLQTAILLQTILSGLIGIAGFAGVSLYEIERWSLLHAVLIHYLIYMAVFIPVAFILGWVGTLADVLITAAILAVMQAIVFLIMCAIYRSQVKELNKLQKKVTKKDNSGGAE